MKITVRNKKPEVKQILIKDVPIGYVFEILNSGTENVKALKLRNGEVVLLMWSNGYDWLELKDKVSWKGSLVRIIGKLAEIIVEEQDGRK